MYLKFGQRIPLFPISHKLKYIFFVFSLYYFNQRYLGAIMDTSTVKESGKTNGDFTWSSSKQNS